MAYKKDNPGVYIPPPLIYLAFFFVAFPFQRWLPIPHAFFESPAARAIGAIFILAGMSFGFPALIRFLKSGNTVVTIKPASCLQTTGIYALSRNPMYVSLMFFYTGFAFLFGNWWHFILTPFVFLVIQQYVIRREENYLYRRFGEDYMKYKGKVRRWI